MPDVSYPFRLDYLRDPVTGQPFPGLWLAVRHPVESKQLEVQCHLDSGAEVSLFDGQIGKAIGLELQDGDSLTFSSTTGAEIVGRRHSVRIGHPELGVRPLEVAFSEAPILRNLLGRDFFGLFQIGFRERQSALMFAPEV